MHLTLWDVSGKAWVSDEATAEESFAEFGGTVAEFKRQFEQLDKMFKEFSTLSHITVLIKGREIVFNPKNLVAVGVYNRFTDAELDALDNGTDTL